ncbi:MAG TPA: YHS domain-containing protein [Candidatus Hypogeohydataceae bacterium YC41]
MLKTLWVLMFVGLILSSTAVMAGEKVFDPVCEKKVDKDGAIQAEYDGKTYYFCCEDCFGKFEKDPDSFACSCPPGSNHCAHCQGKAARCPCNIEQHADEHTGHGHHPEHGH